MSYQLKVIKDNPIGFWHLDETSGSIAYDKSGCSNNGEYVGALATNILPLVSGGSLSTKITNTSYVNLPTTKNYYGQTGKGGFGKSGTSDNDFSLEVWFFPSISTSARTPIFADATNGVGIFYENKSIVFKLNEEEVYYTLNYFNKSIHVIATYNTTSMSLYVDGASVASKSLNGFSFTNSLLSLALGPTTSSSDSFLVDAPAVYRYGLTSIQSLDHFQNGISYVNPIHIVKPDGGKLFSLNDENMPTVYQYEYSVNQFRKFITEDVYYNNDEKYITFYKTDTAVAKEFIINDVIIVPAGIPVTSSKIEWRGENGIAVEYSSDGTTYYPCVNGSALPTYSKDSAITIAPVYIRITMSTTDASKHLPKLSLFRIRFYSNKNCYSDNSGFFIESANEYALGSFNYPPLSRHYTNGLRTSATGGFKIAVDEAVRSVEFFLTASALSATTLISTTATGDYSASSLSWSGAGTISKTNIKKIYVNGVDKTSQTNISNLIDVNNMAHIIILFNDPVSGDIVFNNSGPSNLYNLVSIYASELTTLQISTHYSLYIQKPSIQSNNSSFTLTESGPTYFNNDWVVFSTI